MNKVIVFLLFSVYLSADSTINSAYLGNIYEARAVGMGEAFTAVSGDLNAMFFNPAALAGMRSNAVLLSHTEFFQGIKYEQISGAMPFGNGAVVAGSVVYINNGAMEKRDASGGLLGEFVPYQFVPAVGIAVKLSEEYSVGLNIKTPYESIDDSSSLKVLFDAGVLYHINNYFAAGASIQNLSAYDNMPLNLKLGVGYGSGIIHLVLDANIPSRSSGILNFGNEIIITDYFVIRSGIRYTFNDDFDLLSSLSAGFGFKFDMFRLDYGFRMYNELGNTHFMSLLTEFN